MFSQGLARAASAAIHSRFLVIIRMAIRIYKSFYKLFTRWKDRHPWFYLWQPRVPSRLIHLSREEEERYWLESDLYSRRLRSSDARYDGWKIQDTPPSSLITYYVPRLLPAYRSPKTTDVDSVPYRLSAKIFCKWHHMVFRGPVSPLLSAFKYLPKQFNLFFKASSDIEPSTEAHKKL